MATNRSPKYAERRTMIKKLNAAVGGLVREPSSSVSFVALSIAAQNKRILPDLIRTARLLAIKFVREHLHLSLVSTAQGLPVIP